MFVVVSTTAVSFSVVHVMTPPNSGSWDNYLSSTLNAFSVIARFVWC